MITLSIPFYQNSSILFCCFFLLLHLTSNSQSNADLEGQLKGLTDQAYIRQAISLAELQGKQKNMSGCLYLLDLALRKGDKMNNKAVSATLELSKARVLIAYGDQSDKIVREILRALNACHENDKKRILDDEIIETGLSLNRILTDPGLIGSLHEFIAKLTSDPSTLDKFKSGTLAAAQKDRMQNQLKQTQAAKNRLVVEQSKLQNTVRALNSTKRMLDNELTNKEREILNLNAMTAAQAVELERSTRILDSLKFSAALDSMAQAQADYLFDRQREKLDLETAKSKSMRIATFAMIGASFVLIWLYFMSRRYNTALKEKSELVEKEKNKYQELLLNILPSSIAEELKEHGRVKTKFHETATILFADLENFSRISKIIPSDQLVRDLDECFAGFDRIISRNNIEKIKTIGDAYMCIGGLPDDRPASEINVVKAAIEMQAFLKEWNKKRVIQNLPEFNARIGIHTGPVVAGVVGEKKFAYDVWGDSVNIASRMESNSEPGKINVSKTTYEVLKNDFKFIHRGNVKTKNMNDMEMYFLEVA